MNEKEHEPIVEGGMSEFLILLQDENVQAAAMNGSRCRHESTTGKDRLSTATCQNSSARLLFLLLLSCFWLGGLTSISAVSWRYFGLFLVIGCFL